MLKERCINKVLDVASGKGEFTQMIKYLAGADVQISAIDTNQKLVDFCREKYSEVETILGNAYSIPFEAESFDMVCLSNSLHHFSEPEKVIIEMKRVLKSNGCILIQEMVSDSDQTLSQQNHIAIHHFCAKIDRLCGQYHAETWTRKKLADFVKDIIGDYYKSEYSYEMENVYDAKLLERFEKAIDYYLIKMKKFSEYEDLKAEGEELKINLRKDGFSPAAELLFFVG